MLLKIEADYPVERSHCLSLCSSEMSDDRYIDKVKRVENVSLIPLHFQSCLPRDFSASPGSITINFCVITFPILPIQCGDAPGLDTRIPPIM